MTKPSMQSNKGADFFLVKFWTQMLENPDCRHVCEWAPDGRHLIIYDPDGLMAEIKARGVCKQKDYDSFARQLRIYRWGRVKADECGVASLPPGTKIWRHPRLNRDSPLVEVANVTRNAPPKPNKAAIAAGLPEKAESKPRKRATDIYGGSPSESRNEDDDMSDQHHQREGSSSHPMGQQALPPLLPPSLTTSGDIPVHQPNQQLPPKPNLPPLMPAQMASIETNTVQRLPAVSSRPTPSQTSIPNSKTNKLVSKKKQIPPPQPTVKPTPAFDVETSIFDPNNNFGVTSARVFALLRGTAGSNNGYDIDDLSSESSLSSDDEFNHRLLSAPASGNSTAVDVSLPNRAFSNLAMADIPSLSLPQVSQAFLSKVDYDNAAIEQAAQNPAKYDRLPWSAHLGNSSAANGAGEISARDDTLASLESRLQTISASLRAADAAVAQHAT